MSVASGPRSASSLELDRPTLTCFFFIGIVPVPVVHVVSWFVALAVPSAPVGESVPTLALPVAVRARAGCRIHCENANLNWNVVFKRDHDRQCDFSSQVFVPSISTGSVSQYDSRRRR